MLTSPSNKIYIGQTTTSLEKRWSQHVYCALHKKGNSSCRALSNAIEKYGKDAFKVEVLLECQDEELDNFEVEYIAKYNSLCPNGYNIRTGGKAGKHCDESRERMRLSKLGPLNHNFGKPRTDITKQRISEAKSGENHHFFNKTFKDEHKEKLSQAHRKYDETLPMYVTFVPARPEYYQDEGYAVTNYPGFKNKYFVSKKISLEQKKELAINHLNSLKTE